MLQELERRIDELSRLILHREVSGQDVDADTERMRGALNECWRLRSLLKFGKLAAGPDVAELKERFDPGYRGHD